LRSKSLRVYRQRGLLKAIIEEAPTFGADARFRSVDITAALLRKRFWGFESPKTPEQTVNMCCSQRSDIFEHLGPDTTGYGQAGGRW
jgi:hypothetical protein